MDIRDYLNKSSWTNLVRRVMCKESIKFDYSISVVDLLSSFTVLVSSPASFETRLVQCNSSLSGPSGVCLYMPFHVLVLELQSSVFVKLHLSFLFKAPAGSPHQTFGDFSSYPHYAISALWTLIPDCCSWFYNSIAISDLIPGNYITCLSSCNLHPPIAYPGVLLFLPVVYPNISNLHRSVLRRKGLRIDLFDLQPH